MLDDAPHLEKHSLIYKGDVPKDYDISQMQFTFDFIFLVLKRDTAIGKAIGKISDKYGLAEDYLKDYLVENKYLINKSNAIEFSKQIKSYNTKSLKKILKKNGLKTSGKREKIEKRIYDNKLLGNNCYLSSKSKIFYKNKKRRMGIFNDDLIDHYYFNEFNDFYMDNYRKKKANIPIEFINRHINRAIESKSHEDFISNNNIMAQHFFKKEDYRKMLTYVLRNFCMGLNPIWKIDDLKDHTGILSGTYEDLKFLENKLSKNIITYAYYPIWDSFEFDRIVVSKYEGYRILKDLLNLKDIDKINQYLSNQFYQNDDLKIKKIIQKTLFDF